MPSPQMFRVVRGRFAFVACLACGLAACGGGGDAAPVTSSNPPPPQAQNRSPIVAQENPAQVAVYLHPFAYDAAQGGKTFSDPDGDTLTYQVKLGHSYNPYNDPNPPRGLRVEGSRVVGAPEDQEAIYVTITASDKLGSTADNQFVIRVMPNNPPTVATPNEDRLMTVGGAMDVDGIKSGSVFIDHEGDELTYEVTLRGEPRGLSVNGTRITGALNSIGLVEVTVTAKDAYGGIGRDVFLIAAPAPEPGSPTLPQTSYVYRDEALNLPSTFRLHPQSSGRPFFDTSPADNLTTDAGATLGRVLFYDKRLSITNTVACSSCHSQEHGFANPDRFSAGALGLPLKRNAMALTNVRYSAQHSWFGDMRVESLQDLVLQPLQNPEELGSSLELVVTKLRAGQFYPPLFEAAFGTPEITSERVARAIAQFLQSLISYRAKIDLAFNPMDFGVHGIRPRH